MKKTMNIREFKEYFERKKPDKVIFHTENQDWYCPTDPCKLLLSFQILSIYENPNLICLKSNNNIMYFDRVKSIEVDPDITVLGTLITIFCGGFGSNKNDISYKIITEKTF